MNMFGLLQRAPAPPPPESGDWVDAVLRFIDTPAPYSPLTEYLLVLFVLWLIARRVDHRKETFEGQAQEVLDQKRDAGELSDKAYEKYRQDLITRPKR